MNSQWLIQFRQPRCKLQIREGGGITWLSSLYCYIEVLDYVFNTYTDRHKEKGECARVSSHRYISYFYMLRRDINTLPKCTAGLAYKDYSLMKRNQNSMYKCWFQHYGRKIYDKPGISCGAIKNCLRKDGSVLKGQRWELEVFRKAKGRYFKLQNKQ